MKTMETQGTVICAGRRTAVGSFLGCFKNLSAVELGGAAIRGTVRDSGLDPDSIDEVIMGCVLPAGLGQAPARQAGFAGGLPERIPATAVNKMCGSGMKAIMIAHDMLMSGQGEVVIAGGMESMSNAPYLLPKHRQGARIGHAVTMDHMFLDGLEDAYAKGTLMGEFAEECAESYQFTRQDQDGFAIGSLRRAARAQASGAFLDEIEPVCTTTIGSKEMVAEDEQPRRARFEKIPKLRPAFREDGTITAANSSSISDGAAALMLASETFAQRNALDVKARIVGHATVAQAPRLYTTAPGLAVRKLLHSIGWNRKDVGLWEVNEAFAVVAMAFACDLDLDARIVNVNGGACAIGHPIGASGARIVITLLNAMIQRHIRRGVAAICIGGGEATAIALERHGGPASA